MSDQTSGIQVGASAGTTFIRVEGKGTHLNSHLLKQFINQCLEENRQKFQIDLSKCTYMDSTFLGTLAGLGCKLKEKNIPPIQFLNVSERVLGMLENLGIDHLFEIRSANIATPELDTLTGQAPSIEEKTSDMLAAHEKLVEVDGANASKFQDVISMLRKKV